MYERDPASTVPLGLGFALSMNGAAMERFSNLTQREREALIARTHGIRSPEEMRAFVDDFGQNGVAGM